MKVLVTGADGFAGRHLVRDLMAAGHAPAAFDLRFNQPPPGGVPAWIGDLRDVGAVEKAIMESGADACIHLGGVAFPPEGARSPERTLAINVGGTLNVLHAFARLRPGARVLTVTSALVYGEGGEDPIAEDAPLRPWSLYAVSKAAADLATLAGARDGRLHAMTARPNNHTGPGQALPFVVPAFVRQVRDIRAGRTEPRMLTGNLDSLRDFLDVRDVVRAYRLILERGRAGRAYNMASGALVRIGDLLDRLFRLAGVRPEVRPDPALFRPTDASPRLDTSRIRGDTGWSPATDLDSTLRDMLDEDEGDPA